MVEEMTNEAGGSGEAIERIETEATKMHMLDEGPGNLAIELPCGYILDGKLHVEAVIREMTGHEEDILAAKGPIVGKLNSIIGNCLVSIGGIVDRAEIRRAAPKFTAQDRMALLLAIRRVSLGDAYDINVSCPECKRSQHYSLDLKEIEIVPMPDRMKRVHEDTLPSGRGVQWHTLSSEDEEWLTEKRKNKEDQLTLGLLARVDRIGSTTLDRVKKYKDALKGLKDLSIRDRTWLRDRFDAMEGYIDTEVDFECEECGHSWKAKMDMGQSSFFFPSAK